MIVLTLIAISDREAGMEKKVTCILGLLHLGTCGTTVWFTRAWANSSKLELSA